MFKIVHPINAKNFELYLVVTLLITLMVFPTQDLIFKKLAELFLEYGMKELILPLINLTIFEQLYLFVMSILSNLLFLRLKLTNSSRQISSGVKIKEITLKDTTLTQESISSPGNPMVPNLQLNILCLLLLFVFELNALQFLILKKPLIKLVLPKIG